MKPVITVFAATGNQGGSVARALLATGKFSVRATTRNVESERAKSLQAAGCEVVQAAYNEKESVHKALSGAYGAWFITSFWDSGEGTVEAEVALGRVVAEAAKECGVEHLVYSTLESPAAAAGTAFPTFDAKIGVEQEILYAGVPFTFVQVAWYFNNLENNNPGKHAGWYPWPKDDDGSYLLEVPMAPAGLHGIHNEDVGPCFAAIFGEKEKFVGRKVALSAGLMHGEDMAAAFRKHFPGVQFRYRNPTLEDYGERSKAFGDALVKMYGWYQFRMPRGGDPDLTSSLNPHVRSFDAYLAANKDRFKFD